MTEKLVSWIDVLLSAPGKTFNNLQLVTCPVCGKTGHSSCEGPDMWGYHEERVALALLLSDVVEPEEA